MKPEGVPDEIHRRIRAAISDPGAITPRERNADGVPESVANWGARAVEAAVIPAIEQRALRAASTEQVERVFAQMVDERIGELTAAIRISVADEIETVFGPLAPYGSIPNEGDDSVREVIRHLRGQCTICGRAPDAEPCGHAHAINLRGGRR